MIKRAKQKIAKYRKSAEDNGFSFMPFVVSHNGQILKETAAFIYRQIEQKLMAVDGRVKQSKKQAIATNNQNIDLIIALVCFSMYFYTHIRSHYFTFETLSHMLQPTVGYLKMPGLSMF